MDGQPANPYEAPRAADNVDAEAQEAARFIPFEPFSFLGGGGNGWHDSLSGRRVVRVRR